jgi:hypothetical protein
MQRSFSPDKLLLTGESGKQRVVQKGFVSGLCKSLNLRGQNSRFRVVRRLLLLRHRTYRMLLNPRT